jgi:hypothetical protein
MRGHSLHRLPKPARNTLYLIISLLVFAALTPVLFFLGIIPGAGFVISFLLALFSGVLWRDPRSVLFIAVGYWITNLAWKMLVPSAYENIRSQSFLNAALLVAIFVIIWLRMNTLKKGKL